jgi:hypothetical protein
VIAVTTAPVSAPARIARLGPSTRQQAAPIRQRTSTAVLVVGTILSLGSLIGPGWALRAGVVVALVSAAASCGLAWRELYLTRRRHARELLVAGRQHTEHLRTERRHNADVLDAVTERARRWRQEVDRQQTQIAGLRVEVSALRTDLGSVRRQLVQADGVIAGLREAVRERDLELALSRSMHAGRDAEVQALPRRVRLDRTEVDDAGRAERTVLDFALEAPALPNFEADRLRA